MRYYVEQWHDARWLSLASFGTDAEANNFAYRMHRQGMKIRIIAHNTWLA